MLVSGESNAFIDLFVCEIDFRAFGENQRETNFLASRGFAMMKA